MERTWVGVSCVNGNGSCGIIREYSLMMLRYDIVLAEYIEVEEVSLSGYGGYTEEYLRRDEVEGGAAGEIEGSR